MYSFATYHINILKRRGLDMMFFSLMPSFGVYTVITVSCKWLVQLTQHTFSSVWNKILYFINIILDNNSLYSYLKVTV
jgi:hypothetical protein